jgi:hypothetical protein
MRLFEVHIIVNAGGGQRFARQQFDRGRDVPAGDGRQGGVARDVSEVVTMIVVFEVFEDIADVEERVAIQADVDKSRLHAREDASDFALVYAADECELFLTLNIDFD